MRIMDIVDVILLLMVGLLFHVIFPGNSLAGGMKPDFSLAILFSIILLKRDPGLVMGSALIIGVFTSLTSSVDSGQWINLVDKLVTGGIMYLLVNRYRSFFPRTGILVCLVAILGTIISGIVFGFLVVRLGGLSLNLEVAITRVFLPAAIFNIGATYVFFSSMEFGERLCSS